MLQSSYVGDSALYSPVAILCTSLWLSLSRTNSDPAPITHIVCLCVYFLHFKDTSPTPSRPSRARTVELRRLINSRYVESTGGHACNWLKKVQSAQVVRFFERLVV